MLISLMLAAAQPALPEPTDVPSDAPDCSYDLDAMLKLDRNDFDQKMNSGWRRIGESGGCEAAAAELIREWRHAKRDHASILYWHEGQMRASAGQTDEAIALFKLTYKAAEDDADFGWNHYVAGTIAFLQRDRERLDNAIKNLKLVPKPESASFKKPDGSIVQMRWPPNLNVLEGFAKCWEESYENVYGNRDCSTSPSLEN
ncbi:hypothetical protein [Erythrobacter sp. F6033]|uniref:hypothetical protein n=1 Tax=Erythrobacter sp. F6033 TaxID=2926401 RepID=UPI001FF630DB|nr:hypothetical protein [Erythrobacter sp. F6033]MCK0128996.1 hypothetical protein [Erythrobacter sp. F6033]